MGGIINKSAWVRANMHLTHEAMRRRAVEEGLDISDQHLYQLRWRAKNSIPSSSKSLDAIIEELEQKRQALDMQIEGYKSQRNAYRLREQRMALLEKIEVGDPETLAWLAKKEAALKPGAADKPNPQSDKLAD